MQLQILSTRKYSLLRKAWYNTILAMENEFLHCSNDNSIICLDEKLLLLNKCLRKANERFHTSFKYVTDKKAIREVSNSADSFCFFAAMNLHDIESNKETLKQISEHLIIYIFDSWETQWAEFEELLKSIKPFAICFAYKRSTEFFSKRFENCWFVPQSMDSSCFHEYNVDKSRYFIQIGRRTEPLHNMVLSWLASKNIVATKDNYVFEEKSGKVVFPDTEKLAKEIAKSYFFLAAPRSLMNKARVGNISEVTARFYEAMACKSLIVGVKPEDSFDDLFPFEDAMIEVNDADFSEHIDFYLNNSEKYYEIVNRNYEYLMRNHTWKNRYQTIIELINTTF